LFFQQLSIQVNPRCYKCEVTSYCPINKIGGNTMNFLSITSSDDM